MMPPTVPNSSVTPIKSGATACTLRAKKAWWSRAGIGRVLSRVLAQSPKFERPGSFAVWLHAQILQANSPPFCLAFVRLLTRLGVRAGSERCSLATDGKMLRVDKSHCAGIGRILSHSCRETNSLFALVLALSWRSWSKEEYLSVATSQHFGTFLPQAHHRRFLAIAFAETKPDLTRRYARVLGSGEWYTASDAQTSSR